MSKKQTHLFHRRDSVTNEGRKFDCVVCGSCTVDILVRPVDLQQPIGAGQLHRVDPITTSVGGIVSNAGITMSRLGMSVSALSAVGKDDWGTIVRDRYKSLGIASENLTTHSAMPTSTTVVMIDAAGARSFVHSQGAPKAMNRDDYMNALPLFAQSRAMLLGYYPLLPKMLEQLPEVFSAIHRTGCITCLDAAGGGGTMDPLSTVLPFVDVYVPSIDEASNQTGESEPSRIIDVYRECGAPGILGVKLGAEGALLSIKRGEYTVIEPVEPPGEVIDTTGAGDVFYSALIAAILKGMDLASAGKFAARAGAISVTKPGATTAIVDW